MQSKTEKDEKFCTSQPQHEPGQRIWKEEATWPQLEIYSLPPPPSQTVKSFVYSLYVLSVLLDLQPR